jgi:NAD(P)H-flavin reductase
LIKILMSIKMEMVCKDEETAGSKLNKAPFVREEDGSSRMGNFMSDVRYYIIRTIGCPVPFLPASVPVIGGRSFIEIFLSAAVIALGVLISGGSGAIADYICAVTILLSMRYNILTVLFGISFERAIWWHKVFAVTAIIAVGVHSQKGANTTGIIILACMCLAAVSYFIKPYHFELFYYTHILSYIVILPMIMLHFGAMFFTFAGIFWIIDLVLRYIITQHKEVVSASILPGDVIRLKFKKTFNYKPGQYIFLLVPDVHRIEYHPFSISSAPDDEYVMIHIRELGDWTKKLGDYIRARQVAEKTETVDVTVYLEGPYGTHQINLDNPEYEVLLLVSGGIGITPLQSLYSDLIHQVQRGRPLRKVLFVWSVKDRALVDALHDHHKDNEDAYLPMAFQPPMPPVSRIRSQRIDSSQVVAPAAEPEQLESAASTQDDPKAVGSSYVFLNKFFLTQVRSKEDFDAAGIHPTVQTWLQFGRPPLDGIFDDVKKLCKDEHIKRVGVCVCGPPQLVAHVKDLCYRSQLHPGQSTVRFDVHSEVFDF